MLLSAQTTNTRFYGVLYSLVYSSLIVVVAVYVKLLFKLIIRYLDLDNLERRENKQIIFKKIVHLDILYVRRNILFLS